jgi:hypothetical protein
MRVQRGNETKMPSNNGMRSVSNVTKNTMCWIMMRMHVCGILVSFQVALHTRFVVLQKVRSDFYAGELEVDEEGDFWADHDERCHGTIDSAWARKEYPEGFMWDCCDRLGNEEGCESGPHMPDLGKRAKMRA